MEHLKPLEEAIGIIHKLTVELSDKPAFIWSRVYHAELYLNAQYQADALEYLEASNG